jgi:hypothetical protein
MRIGFVLRGPFCAALRPLALALFAATWLPAFTLSVEFPFTALPRPVWGRELAHLKEMGVAHVSLPPATDDAQLDEVIGIVRRLGLEADLEGPLPGRLQALGKSHGGPLTELPGAVRISAIMPRALDNERKLLTSGTQAIVWTDVFETLRPGYLPGAITLAGSEGGGAALIRREAQLARFWGTTLTALPESPGARLAIPVEGVSVRQYIAETPATSVPGLSLVSIVNDSAAPWKGEVRVMYPALQRPIALPAVALGAYEVLWLPVNIPLTAGALCTGCNGFAPSDHLAYATAELTGMEYENGILAMEFIAKSPGEVVLQLSHEPVGLLMAGGHPSVFDWDAKTQRARLPIPAGNAKTGRVRVALAVDAPNATAFFDNASVLLIGETNPLTAEFSPPDVASRSRVRTVPELTVTADAPAKSEDKEKPATITYRFAVPSAAIPGDTAQLAIEADGIQLSHSLVRILMPAALTFDDAVTVRLAANSSLTLSPATIPVNRKTGREVIVSLHNNAPEIRTFQLSLNVPGLEFSPATMTVSVGASVARDVTFRVFISSATAGLHAGTASVSGATTLSVPVRFVVLPPEGAINWSAEGFSILETAKSRASFLAGRWLEMIDKESGRDAQPAGGTTFDGGLATTVTMEELELLSHPTAP